jgi:hypothetical protein
MNELHMIFIINLLHTKFVMIPKILNHHNNALVHITTIYYVEWWKKEKVINFYSTTNFSNSHDANKIKFQFKKKPFLP